MNDATGPGAEQEAGTVYASLRRRPIRRRRVYRRPASRRWLLIALALLVLGGAAAGFAYYRSTKFYYAIVVNDTVVTALDTREQADEALRRVRARYAPVAPDVISFAEGEPQISARRHLHPVDIGTAAEIIDERLTPQQYGYAIFINGVPHVMLGSEELAVETLSRALEIGLNGQPGIPTFTDVVRIALLRRVQGQHEFLKVMTPAEAAAELTHPPRQRYHIVKSGDNFWSIANANGLIIPQLDALNPQFKKDHLLHIGDRVRLPDELAPLRVVVVRKP